MKIFVSSTVYDLIDVRAEVRELLLDLRLGPVMSDHPDSEFDVTLGTNSIEVCLDNVDRADFVVVIFNQRYGPSLKGAGFPDKSATHLEYDRALEQKKPLLVLVRDRLYADYKTWQKDNSAKLYWVREARDHALFELLQSHERLTASTKPNWLATYRDSIELKQILRAQLRGYAGKALARILWERRELPWFDVSLTQTVENGQVAFDVALTLRSEHIVLQDVRVQLLDGEVEWGRTSGNLGAPKLTHGQHVRQRYRTLGVAFEVKNLVVRVRYISEHGYALTELYEAIPGMILEGVGGVPLQICSRSVTGSPEV